MVANLTEISVSWDPEAEDSYISLQASFYACKQNLQPTPYTPLSSPSNAGSET